jgi:DNA-binding NarL/FixJ family response regulator
MILVAVDDLLFSSKIRATAKQTGVDLVFARSPEEVLEQARTHQPSLAIFDLNSAKTDPVASIAALKKESTTRVVAFASHIHTDLIDAGRSAGADHVMPRSAFATHLADILLSAKAPQP